MLSIGKKMNLAPGAADVTASGLHQHQLRGTGAGIPPLLRHIPTEPLKGLHVLWDGITWRLSVIYGAGTETGQKSWSRHLGSYANCCCGSFF